jgi:uncharacterized protein YjbI with pentapeptide repeats
MKSAAVMAFTVMALSLGPTSGARAACADPAGPKVDWEGCDKQSARLGEADLGGANLRKVDFRDADLRRANLLGADLTGATLSHADLSRATWTDGRIRGFASDGECN